MIGNRQGKDVPETSSNTQSSTSTVAGVVVSGGGMATFHNQNQSVAGLNTKPGATATPISSNVSGGVVSSHHGQVTINYHNYPPGQQITLDGNAGSMQLPAPSTSSTAIGIDNKGSLIQHNHGCTYHIGGSDQPQDKKTKMLRAINKVMWNKIDSNIEVIKTKSNVSLDSRVYPQFAESDFYKDFPEHSQDGERQEYVKDDMFRMDKKQTGNPTHTFKSVMEEFCQPVDQQNHERLAVFGLFAQAGAGKTTCMRHWAKHAMIDSKCSPEHEFYTPHETNRFSLILYYDLKSCNFKENTTLKDFLFDGIVEEAEKKPAYDWVLENQSKVIIFFDGLDQATWTINEEHEIDVGPHGLADTPAIMHNLLSRSSLPQSRIILSSREFKAATLPHSARPEKIFIMQGFSPDDAESVFNSLVFYNFHKNPWEEFSKTSASLNHFLTIPMFLAFSVLVYGHSKGSLPNSVTLLLVKVLELLQRSSNVQERKNIWQIISKLKSLAHNGMENQVVVFTRDDLTKYELTVEEVRDLLFMVPSKNTLNQCLMEGDFLLFFCHQCVQEFLSACFIVELPLSHFKQFVKDDLNESEWTVVRRFVCGLVFLKVIDKRLVQISDKDKKQDILRRSLAEQLKFMSPDLELYAAIYESNDDSVIHLITRIEIHYQSVSSDGAHLLGSIMARCKKLDLFKIFHCGLDNNLLRIMAKSIGYPKIQVRKIHLQDYSFDFAALNDFLEHADSELVYFVAVDILRDVKEDGQRCEFDWRNIQQLRVYGIPSLLPSNALAVPNIYFRNMHDSIILTIKKNELISQEEEFGSYNKKSKTLTVTLKEGGFNYSIGCVAFAVHWLNRCSLSLDIKGNLCMQYLNHKFLAYLAGLDITGITKIESILLDCLGFEKSPNLEKYPRDITFFVKKFQVKVMDLVISFQQIGDMMVKLVPLLRLRDCKLRIHVVLGKREYEDVESEDIKKQLAVLKRTEVQIESLRLIFASIDNLAPWIQNLSEAKVKQFIVYIRKIESEAYHEKVKCEAHSHGIELTFVNYHDIDRNDPWERVYWTQVFRYM